MWLAESILVHILGTKFFPNMGFVQKYSKYKLSFWPNLEKNNNYIFQ